MSGPSCKGELITGQRELTGFVIMSGDSIILINGDELVEMPAESYELEADLQEQITRYPDLLAAAQIAPEYPRRWLLISRELPAPDSPSSDGCWSLHHLFVDQDPKVVEIRRSSSADSS